VTSAPCRIEQLLALTILDHAANCVKFGSPDVLKSLTKAVDIRENTTEREPGAAEDIPFIALILR
jgi:hypothetical protein